MERLIHTTITSTALILMLVVHCGVVTETCACTGRTSLVLPFGDDCCPSDGNCMTVSVHQFAGNYLLSDTHLAPVPEFIAPTFTLPDPPLAVVAGSASAPICSSPPPRACCTRTILRV